MSIEHLFNTCDAIGAAMADLRGAMASGAAVGATMRTLADLATHLADLFEREESRIFGRLRASPHGSLDDQRAFQARAEAVHEAWHAHLVEWSADCVEADPDGFAEETETMLGAIETMIGHARSTLYPTALATGLIKLRAA